MGKRPAETVYWLLDVTLDSKTRTWPPAPDLSIRGRA